MKTFEIKSWLQHLLFVLQMHDRRCMALCLQIVAINFIINPAFGNDEKLIAHGRYLATIGACDACHTPPKVDENVSTKSYSTESLERRFRTDPDWTLYLDSERSMSGGVPFWLRFSGISHGVVYSRNLTPDKATGLGLWSDDEIIQVLLKGVRKDGTSLFLFAPHTFYKHLAFSDAIAIVAYLRTLKPVYHKIPDSSLPFPVKNSTASFPSLHTPPTGRNKARAEYLMNAIVGCKECHSYSKNGIHNEFVGGDPSDPFTGVFRLGPDLPLRANERGFANFPYPGYAVLYAGNLTSYGKDGPFSAIKKKDLVKAIRNGISPHLDIYKRPIPLEHVMLWQYYHKMSDDDVYAIVDYIKNLSYVPHEVNRIEYFGTDWKSAFNRIFGESPTNDDSQFFGK